MAHYTISIGSFREEFFPRTLQELCIQKCTTSAGTIFFEQRGDKWILKNGTLPIFFEEVWKRYDHSAPEYLPMMLEIGRHVESNQIPLKRIDMSNCKILNDNHLQSLMRTLPVSLAINNCPLLTNEAFKIINRYGENLVNLNFGSSASRVIPKDMQDWIEDAGDGLLKTPNLVKLTIWGLKVRQYQHISMPKDDYCCKHTDFWELLTRAFAPKLVHLDLSDCQVQNLSFLTRSKDTLRSLHLSNILKYDFDWGTWGVLANLGEIRFLDISRYSGLEWGPCPVDIPQDLLDTLGSMKKLECLDKAGLRGVPEKNGLELLPLSEATGNDGIRQFVADVKHYSQRRNGAYIPVLFLALLQRIKFGVPWMPINSLGESVKQALEKIENPSVHVAGMRILVEAVKREQCLGPARRQSLFHLAYQSMNKSVLNVGVTESGILLCSTLSMEVPAWEPSFAQIMIGTLLRAAKNAAETLTDDPFGSKRSILNRIPMLILENVDVLTASQITSISLENDLFNLHCTLMGMDHMKVVAERYGHLYLRFNPGGLANLCNNDHMLQSVLRAVNG